METRCSYVTMSMGIGADSSESGAEGLFEVFPEVVHVIELIEIELDEPLQLII